MQNSARDLIANLPPATVPFFAVFSRFECALKRSGYLKKNTKFAEADWAKFSEELGKLFLDEVRSSDDASTLITKPPKKQIKLDGQLGWKDAKPIENVRQLFDAVCRVRNNLFHGGKYPHSFVDDTSRDQNLLLGAMKVLERALEQCPNVKMYFDVDYDTGSETN